MRDSSSHWQKTLSEGFRFASELLSFLELPAAKGSLYAEKQFPTRVPRGFAARMQKKNIHDPLLRQVLAVDEELDDKEGFEYDPLEEKNSNPIKGLIHKYPGRVLFTLTGGCAINCRYCFRRHFPYQNNNPGRKGWKEAIDYIKQDSSIYEVILSGGDPLLASDESIRELFNELETITHLKMLRIHTRIPIVLPERINSELLKILESSRFLKVLVVHSNHPQELNAEVAEGFEKLRLSSCQLLNQSVLLAGVNDKAEILAELSQTLFASGVMPYYLHLLDKVQGAAHFDLDRKKALNLYHHLQTLLPGYLVPRLAKEEPGKKSKTIIA